MRLTIRYTEKTGRRRNLLPLLQLKEQRKTSEGGEKVNIYATIDDMTALWRPMTPEETTRAEALLSVVSASLRTEAKKVGKNLDEMVAADEDLAMVAKSVTVDVTARTLMTSTDKEPTVQASESALGYSSSATFLVPGGGLFIKKSELARLGLRRQRYGAVEVYGTYQGNNNHSV